jgi:hypothetical protein
LVSVTPGQKLRVDQLAEAPIVALVLRRAGQGAQADQMLRQADRLVGVVYRRSKVPFWFDADTAALRAVQGHTDEALQALERAMNRGWTHNGVADLRDINDEPAFQSLHGKPRFERLRAQLAAHEARERAETLSLELPRAASPGRLRP